MISMFGRDRAALGGLAFVVFLAGSAVMLGELVGAFGDPDAVFEEHFSDSGNRTRDVVGGYLLTFAAISFLVFVAGVEERLRQTLGDSALGRLARSSGTLFAGVLAVSAATWMAVSLSIAFGQGFGDERPFNSGYAMVPQVGYVLFFVVAPIVASVHVLTVTLAFRRLSPVFVTVIGYVCGFALLFSVISLPVLALPVWVLTVAFTGGSKGGQLFAPTETLTPASGSSAT